MLPDDQVAPVVWNSQNLEDGAGIEPSDDRLCRPMPYHLATRPSLKKIGSPRTHGRSRAIYRTAGGKNDAVVNVSYPWLQIWISLQQPSQADDERGPKG